MAFAGSMFAGITKGATEAFGEQGLGGQLYKSIVAAQGRDLLKERDNQGGDYGSPGTDPTGKGSTSASGAGTPYGTGSGDGGGGGGGGGDRPTPGAPYVQEKPAPAPPGMDAFNRKGKPFPTATPSGPAYDPAKEMQTYEPYPGGKNDPNAPSPPAPSALPVIVQQEFPGFKQLAPAGSILNMQPPVFPQSGKYPWFIPDSWTRGPPKPGDVLNGKVFDGVSWKSAPEGGVVPGTTQAIPVPP